VGAFLCQGALVQNQDAVAVSDAVEPVGYHDHGHVRGELLQCLLELSLGNGIQCGGCLVQDQNAGLSQQGTGNCQPLALSAADIAGVFLQHGIQTEGIS